ncbi:MAG: histidinol dehydrogenase, partial [Prevotella sp.]|nr:histidinol dehydrogenase [Prevotella sp.]
MNVHIYPEPSELVSLLRRPAKNAARLAAVVGRILDDVRTRGDDALREYELQFDRAVIEDFAVSGAEIDAAAASVGSELRAAIELAHKNIAAFHSFQAFRGEKCRVAPGVECWQKSIPIERVGLYIPGGTAPLFSTVLMLATPARIAGCREIILCTPPSADGTVHPAILTAARVAGVSRIFKAGGVQAIGAMAYGTASIPKVYKILGPGNQYVTAAKQMVSPADAAIDMPAGPSEVMVLADGSSDVSFVASDLLSQAEHGVDSQVVLLTTSAAIGPDGVREVDRQLSA